MSQPSPAGAARVVAVVKDLFFVARIGETARLAGMPIQFVKTADALAAALGSPTRFVLLDLTGDFDYDRVFATLEPRRSPVLGFTTHALARRTQPWHARCDRVVTKETLTQELPSLLTGGVTAKDQVAP